MNSSAIRMPTAIRTALITGVGLAATLLAPVASAAYMGALSFIEPTGTVGQTDSIPVWVRFTLDPGSDALDLSDDPGASPPFGLPLANYPTGFSSDELQAAGTYYYQLDSIDSLSYVGLNTSYTCSGTFTDVCSPGAYAFNFNTSGPESINYRPMYNGSPFVLQPGGYFDYLFGTFEPSGGSAAPGAYQFYKTDLFLQIQGLATWRIQATDEQGLPVYDENDDPVYLPDLQTARLSGELYLATTPCEFNADPSCPGAFTRTVVPAPATVWLLGTGVGLVAWRTRKRCQI